MKRLTSLLTNIFARVRSFRRGPASTSARPTSCSPRTNHAAHMPQLHATPFSKEEAYLTSSELAGFLGISPSCVRDHAARRRQPGLPAIRFNDRQWFFHERHILEWSAHFSRSSPASPRPVPEPEASIGEEDEP